MGRVNALWQDAYQAVFDDLMAHKIDMDEAMERMTRLGFERADAHDQLTTGHAEHHRP